MVCTLVSVYCEFRLLIQRYAQFWLFRKGSGNSYSTTFCVCFWCYILLADQISLSNCLYFLRYWIYVYCNCLFPRLWRVNLEIDLIFLIKPFFVMTEKSWQKLIENEKPSRHLPTRCEICSKLTMKTPERRHWCLYCWLWTNFTPCSAVSIVNFEQVNNSWESFQGEIKSIFHQF